MGYNPIMKAIGLGPIDRTTIFLAGDADMCLGSIEAFLDHWDFDAASSGARKEDRL